MTVTAAARLHLGFLDLSGDLGRRFGGIGLAIDSLGTRLALRRAAARQIEGAEAERTGRYLTVVERFLGLEVDHHLTIEEAIPPHAGLGSGTQLALAIAAAARRLHGRPLEIDRDAVKLDRGARSGVGIGLFGTGGLVVDAGRGPATRTPPIVSRMAFPSQWRVLIVLDPSLQGINGAAERVAFGALAPMAATDAAQLCRLALMQALPAIAEQDLERFGRAIGEMQGLLGDYFAPSQGGDRFASRKVAAVLEELERAGAHGAGQSSWGPTGFAFAASPAEAARLAATARPRVLAGGLDICIASGLNRGAEIGTVATPRPLAGAARR